MPHSKGWIPQVADERDYKYEPPITSTLTAFPGRVSLRESPHNGPVLDQGQLGTCVPNSNADAYHFLLSKEGEKAFLPSRLYIYAVGRTIEGCPLSEDDGMQVRDALKVLARGVPPEVFDPYSDANPGPFQKAPSSAAVAAATSHAVQYLAVQSGVPGPHPVRTCLAQGYPFTFGFQVPNALESEAMATGAQKLLSLPKAADLSGEGHGVECVGYDFTCTEFHVPVFEIKNSWGADWCDGGYFFMDWRFFSAQNGIGQLAEDLWTLRSSN